MSNENQRDEWIERAKERGWADGLRLTLDALAPFGALGAQMLWVLQPTLSLWVRKDTLAHIAHTLEQPDELARVRDALQPSPDDQEKPMNP